MHRTLVAALKIGSERLETQTLWDVVLSCAVFAFLNSPLEGVSYSPHELVFGYNLPSPLDEAWGAVAEVDIDVSSDDSLAKFVGGKREVLEIIRQSVSQAAQDAREKSSNRVNVGREAATFQVGDLVGRRIVHQSVADDGFARKLAYAAAGPYRIEEMSNALGAQTLTLRHVKDTAVRYHLTAKDVFEWKEPEDERLPLDTVLRTAELRFRAERRQGESTRRNKPKGDEDTVDEHSRVRIMGDLNQVDDSEDAWRDDENTIARFRKLVDEANEGTRFVLVHRTRGDRPDEPKGTRVDIARIVEAVAPGIAGAHVGIHYYQLREVKKTADGGSTVTVMNMTSWMERTVQWDVDSPATSYEALPLWRAGTDVVAANVQPRGYAADEDVVPLHQVVGTNFTLLPETSGATPRWVPKALFREWKTRQAVPRVARDAMTLRSSRSGTRSDPVLWTLTTLTFKEVRDMTAAETRAACEERGIPTTSDVEGKKRTTPFLTLKEDLRKWIATHGQQRPEDDVGRREDGRSTKRKAGA